jgi:hypothetical protein
MCVHDQEEATANSQEQEQFSIKAYVMDDERIRAGGSILTEPHFEEQFQRIRVIRLSEQNWETRLNRLAAFQNPEFYKAQAMRMSVWDKPRVIGCAENCPQHIALPRGSLDAAVSLLRDNGIACGKAQPTGRIDIAVMQSLSRQGEVKPLVEHYGQVIVDECHHIGAVSFEAILKGTRAKYVLGLTATPIRRDGQQPIIRMQCGPIRHTAATSAGAPQDLEVLPRSRFARIDLPSEAAGSTMFRPMCSAASASCSTGPPVHRLRPRAATPLA